MIQPIILKNELSIQDMEENQIISTALKCLENRLRYDSQPRFADPKNTCDFLRLQIGNEQDEIFAALFLNSQNQLIAFEKLFFGTVNQATIHPRKVIKKCLEHNAAHLIITHNHTSQDCSLSEADKEVTATLKDILTVMDVKLLDHIIVSSHETFSLAENGLL